MSGLHIRRHSTFPSLHAVFRDNVRVTGFMRLEFAQKTLDRKLDEEAGKRRTRKCLCCDEVFESEGPHHRLCNHHRATVGGLGREMAG
jgi:hypothetical protein